MLFLLFRIRIMLVLFPMLFSIDTHTQKDMGKASVASGVWKYLLPT